MNAPTNPKVERYKAAVAALFSIKYQWPPATALQKAAVYKEYEEAWAGIDCAELKPPKEKHV